MRSVKNGFSFLSGIVICVKKLINIIIMETKIDEYPEPPELKKQNIPPLMKIVKYLTIGIAVAFVIVLIFALIFWSVNK